MVRNLFVVTKTHLSHVQHWLVSRNFEKLEDIILKITVVLGGTGPTFPWPKHLPIAIDQSMGLSTGDCAMERDDPSSKAQHAKPPLHHSPASFSQLPRSRAASRRPAGHSCSHRRCLSFHGDPSLSPRTPAKTGNAIPIKGCAPALADAFHPHSPFS